MGHQAAHPLPRPRAPPPVCTTKRTQPGRWWLTPAAFRLTNNRASKILAKWPQTRKASMSGGSSLGLPLFSSFAGSVSEERTAAAIKIQSVFRSWHAQRVYNAKRASPSLSTRVSRIRANLTIYHGGSVSRRASCAVTRVVCVCEQCAMLGIGRRSRGSCTTRRRSMLRTSRSLSRST
jgi:hypothetical protein